MPTGHQKYNSGQMFDAQVSLNKAQRTVIFKRDCSKTKVPLSGPWDLPGRDLAPETLQGSMFVDFGELPVDVETIL